MGEEVLEILATTHEVSLKGGNRRWFERHLQANVQRALEGLPVTTLRRPSSRVLVRFARPVPYLEAARRLGTVFGLASIAAVECAGATLEEVERFLEPRLGTMPGTTFAVRCKRSDKTFPATSLEIERRIGAFVRRCTGRPVDLTRPDHTVQLLVDRGGIWLVTREVPGPGGLPVGTGGRAAVLLSGGIDSPVAAWMMAKRGMRLDLVHFHSVPRTDPASLEKVEELAAVLARWAGPVRLAMVPLLEIQEAIVARCPARLRVLLYRRFMLRIAERLARRWRARALVTGESLGQVASQTVENLAAVEVVTGMPVLRPLVGLDKEEIVARARRAGTFEISIRPHFDCCSYLVPAHPATRADASDLGAAEAVLPADELVRAALRGTETVRIEAPARWEAIPPPPGVEVTR